MANQTIFFSGTINDDVILNLRARIKAAFSSASISTTTPTAGTVITFSDLNTTYQAARQAMFALTKSFGSFTLGSFQGSTLKAAHGIGIVEKTVGELENVCTAFFSTNFIDDIKKCSSNNVGHKSTFTAEANATNFSAVNSSFRSVFTAAKNNTFTTFGSNAANRVTFTAECSTNFASVNDTFRSVFTAVANSTNFSGTNSANRTAVTGKNTTNFSGVNSANNLPVTAASNSSNFAIVGPNFTKRSVFTASGNDANFSGHGLNFANRVSGQPFSYMTFHTSQGGVKATVFSSVNKQYSSFGDFNTNCSSNTAQNSSNFSSHGDFAFRNVHGAGSTSFSTFGTNSANRSVFTAECDTNFASVFNTFRGVFTAVANSTNFSGTNSANRTAVTASNSTNFTGVNSGNRASFVAAVNSTNFSANGTNSTNRSVYTAVANSTNFSGNNSSFFSSFTPAFFASNAKTCIVVHSVFKVQGVDF